MGTSSSAYSYVNPDSSTSVTLTSALPRPGSLLLMRETKLRAMRPGYWDAHARRQYDAPTSTLVAVRARPANGAVLVLAWIHGVQARWAIGNVKAERVKIGPHSTAFGEFVVTIHAATVDQREGPCAIGMTESVKPRMCTA